MKYILIILLFTIAFCGVKCSGNHDIQNKAQKIKKRSASMKKQLDNTGLQNKVNESNELTNKNEKTLKIIDSIKSSQDPINTYKSAIHTKSLNIDDYRTAFYGFIGLSIAAIMFFSCKAYRLRVSRAERRYGVLGDRAAQELTPLPLALEDGNSDDEDHTIFDITRQQIVL